MLKKRKWRGKSVQDLMDIRGFTKYGVETGGGELLFFQLTPVNTSVLSYANTGFRIGNLQKVLTQIPELEILCADSCESFDANRTWLHKRAYEESNAAVRRILHQDAQMLLGMQGELATSRQFVFLRRCSGMKPEQVRTLANDTHKILAEAGMQVKRMEKSDIKRFLSIWFGASQHGEDIPDVDGAQFVKGGKRR